MPKTLDFLFSPVDPPRSDSEAKNPHAKASTHVPEVVEATRKQFPGGVLDVTVYANEYTMYVDRSLIVEVCRFLKDDQDFNYVSDMGGIDRFTEEDRFEVFYNLVSMSRGKRLRVKVRTSEEDPTVPSIVGVYASANWHERECWDMFGIRFDGHPDLRRMFMPEDYQYFPQRKEFPSLGIPGSLPLPSQTDDGKLVDDPYPAAHGSRPLRRTPSPE